jgi:hypothetical protein
MSHEKAHDYATKKNTEENTTPRHPRKLVMKTVDQSPYVQMAPSEFKLQAEQ